MAGHAVKISRKLAQVGRTMKLRRRVGTTSSYTDVDVKGTDRGYKPAEIAGLLQQGDRKVIISTAEIIAASWPAPPKKGDFLVIDTVTTAVQGSEARYEGTEILAYELWVRG